MRALVLLLVAAMDQEKIGARMIAKSLSPDN
jgi:hypothetical protein